jgi:3-deoxy-D-manno-octulosonic-acid transferase
LSGALWALAAGAARPALLLMLRRRLARGKELPGRLAERQGIETAPRPIGRLLWLHAASVGEAVSALPLLEALPADLSVLFTTGTVTSAALLAERLPAQGLTPRVFHRFVPLDVPLWAARFLDHWRPDAACFLESELWPNLIAACRARAIPIALVNARLSARSAAAWSRVPGLARDVLGSLAFVSARSEEDARRLTGISGRPIETEGDLKLAAELLPADQAELGRLGALLGDRPRLLAASTHPGEEAMIARVHEALAARHPGLLTAIVPRHPERGAALAALLGADRRSEGCDPPPGGLWLADTLGELGLLYRLFPVVVVGRSFPPNAGGQNPLEPARLGCAVAIGPAHGNFGAAVRRLGQAGSLTVVEDEAALAAWASRMLSDPQAVCAAGEAGRLAATGDAALPARLASRLVALMP